MLNGKRIAVVMPAYNASKTLEQTYREIPADLVDEVILVDDASIDDTAALAESLGIVHVIRHDFNKGYGANQKTCYTRALELGADIIIMLHPDYQYNPKLIPVMAALIADEGRALGVARQSPQGLLADGRKCVERIAHEVSPVSSLRHSGFGAGDRPE